MSFVSFLLCREREREESHDRKNLEKREYTELRKEERKKKKERRREKEEERGECCFVVCVHHSPIDLNR